MSKTTFTDLAAQADSDGIYDLTINAITHDFNLTGGMDSSLLVSLFTDRRAAPDEVADPLKRRGWCGNDHAGIPNENWGSGLWLYEQSRLVHDTTEGLRMEAIQCLNWTLEEKLMQSVDVTVTADPYHRRATINVVTVDDFGVNASRSYRLWSNTAETTLT